jgi:hypothetical protein
VKQLSSADTLVEASIGVTGLVSGTELLVVPARETLVPSENLLYLVDLLEQHFQAGKRHLKLPGHSSGKNELQASVAHYSERSS